MTQAGGVGSTSSSNPSSHHSETGASSGIFSSMMIGGVSSTASTHGNHHPIVRGTIASCLRIRTLADVLPAILQPLVSNGKLSVLFFIGSQMALFGLWIPFWLLSLGLGEGGTYAFVALFVVSAGRGILRMIAFPGSSHRITNEIEKEFTKYSVRVLITATTSLIEVSEAFRTMAAHSGGGILGSGNPYFYNVQSLWNRAKSYRNKVLGVYCEVLKFTLSLEGPGGVGSPPSSDPATNLNRYGNNHLVGDVGNLKGLTPEAIADGQVLLNYLETVLDHLDIFEGQAKTILEGNGSTNHGPLDASRQAAATLHASATELCNFVESLRPPSSSSSTDDTGEVRSAADLQNEANNNATITETMKTGLSSILPMLDPPPHASIFGFDVLRGCVLSRYKGARQLWIPRQSGGGMIDCLHIPAPSSIDAAATSHNNSLRSNSKAVLYCNPNAGLIEVATGMSLAGGNVGLESENAVNDNCWTDFYTNDGFDIYLFNYAGFGRSYGPSYFCGVLPCGSSKPADTKPTMGILGRIARIFYGFFVGFSPTPDSLRADGLSVASHILSQGSVESLVIHGESIGGLAASGTARALTTDNPLTRSKVALLLCDRTFCNLEAVAQRLVGGWSGYAIRLVAPFWSTDVVGDFLAASCPKIVATDSADVIIADSSSLKAGISHWKEIQKSASNTKGIGWMMDAPLSYKMADWENTSVNGSRYATRVITPPVWPSDKHISIDEAFHFAACAKRIGKLASMEKKRFVSSTLGLPRDPEGADPSDSCQSPIYLVWKYLGCCEGLCGAPLGASVKGGFDNTVSWLSSMCVFGGQTVVEGIEHRHQWSDDEASSKGLQELGAAQGSDFDCRPPGYETQETDAVVHPKPIPEVVEALRKIVQEYPNDAILSSVTHEVAFVIDTLEYVVSRLSAPNTVETSWKSRHLHANGSMREGSFMNLHCGHNNPFSSDERKRLQSFLKQTTSNRVAPPEVV